MDIAIHYVANLCVGTSQSQPGDAQGPNQVLFIINHQNRVDILCVFSEQTQLIEGVRCGRLFVDNRVFRGHQATGGIVLVLEKFSHFRGVNHGLKGFGLFLVGNVAQQINSHVWVCQIKNLSQFQRCSITNQIRRFFRLQVLQNLSQNSGV